MLNISGTSINTDPTFRYKMPAILTKVEGRGNGIKTVLVNLSDIADSLNRPPILILKFLAIQSASAIKSDNILNGQHSPLHLQAILNRFIDIFVLCPICHLPETTLAVNNRTNSVKHKCSACGVKTLITSHSKLLGVILKMAAAS